MSNCQCGGYVSDADKLWQLYIIEKKKSLASSSSIENEAMLQMAKLELKQFEKFVKDYGKEKWEKLGPDPFMGI